MSLSYRASSRPSWLAGYGSSSASLSSSRTSSAGYSSSSSSRGFSSSGRLNYLGAGVTSSASAVRSPDSYQRRGSESGAWRSDISRTGLYPATSVSSSFSTSSRVSGAYVDTGLNRSPRDFTRGSLGTSSGSGDISIARRRSSTDKISLASSVDASAGEYSRTVRRHSTRFDPDSTNARLKEEDAPQMDGEVFEKAQSRDEVERRSSLKKAPSSFRRGRETFRSEDSSVEVRNKDTCTQRVLDAKPDVQAEIRSSSKHSTARVQTSTGTGAGKDKASIPGNIGQTLPSERQQANPSASERPRRFQRASFRERRRSQASSGAELDDPVTVKEARCRDLSTGSRKSVNTSERDKDFGNTVSPSGTFDSKLASYVKDCDEKTNLPVTVSKSRDKEENIPKSVKILEEERGGDKLNSQPQNVRHGDRAKVQYESKDTLMGRDEMPPVTDDMTCQSVKECHSTSVVEATGLGIRKSSQGNYTLCLQAKLTL